jgi:hypothetical protein
MGLVEEPHLGGDRRQRLAVQDALPREIEPPGQDIGVRRDAERGVERPDQPGRARPDDGRRLGHRHRGRRPLVEVRPQRLGEVARGDRGEWSTAGLGRAVRLADPLDDEGQARLGLERVVDAAQRVVDGRQALP